MKLIDLLDFLAFLVERDVDDANPDTFPVHEGPGLGIRLEDLWQSLQLLCMARQQLIFLASVYPLHLVRFLILKYFLKWSIIFNIHGI